MSSRNAVKARRNRAAEFAKQYPKLVKAKRIGRVVCLDTLTRHYRLYNNAGGCLDYWAGTGTWLVRETSERGVGIEQAIDVLKGLQPAPKVERTYEGSTLVTIFADASFDYRTRAGGWAAWVKAGGRPGIYGHGVLKTDAATAMHAEMAALANGLHLAKTSDVLTAGCPVLLQSDCMLALQIILSACPGAGNSAAAGGLDVVALRQISTERREIAALQSIIDTAAELDLRIWVRHVKGHTGQSDARSHVNAQCDQMARAAMRQEQASRRSVHV